MSDERTKPRIKFDPSAPGSVTGSIECATDHTDGYRITVGWSEPDEAWIARASGMTAFVPGEAIGTGPTKEAALLDLCCALCATVDCLGQALDAA
jgi:hypothetical protein